MTQQLFWRVCHKTSKLDSCNTFGGPYQTATNISDELDDAHASSPRHPLPRKEAELSEFWYLHRDSSVCGTGSAADLRRWFEGFWLDLQSQGFVVRVYQLDSDAMRVSSVTGQALAVLPRKCRARRVIPVRDFLKETTA